MAAVQGFWSKVQTLALDCGRRGKGDKGVVECVAKGRRLAAGRGPVAGEMTPLMVATLGASGGVAGVSWMLGGTGVALPCQGTSPGS